MNYVQLMKIAMMLGNLGAKRDFALCFHTAILSNGMPSFVHQVIGEMSA